MAEIKKIQYCNMSSTHLDKTYASSTMVHYVNITSTVIKTILHENFT